MNLPNDLREKLNEVLRAAAEADERIRPEEALYTMLLEGGVEFRQKSAEKAWLDSEAEPGDAATAWSEGARWQHNITTSAYEAKLVGLKGERDEAIAYLEATREDNDQLEANLAEVKESGTVQQRHRLADKLVAALKMIREKDQTIAELESENKLLKIENETLPDPSAIINELEQAKETIAALTRQLSSTHGQYTHKNKD